ncbi:hypothetical protein BDZ97DRAFT_1790492 [Flammula alnicola]|nr:hypothetical protein BDZ97DRAFT_1790492 [Flammula alnicola]
MASTSNNTGRLSSIFSFGRAPLRPLQPQPQPQPPLSEFSTRSVADSAWSSMDFMLGAGMVIIQQNTHKIVVIYETKRKYWFFPRGRKDIGESLEQTALREAYEESGYRTEFLPLYSPTRQPAPPQDEDAYARPNIEPIFMTLSSWQPRRTRTGQLKDSGGEYLTTWYAGQIPEDAVPETGTGMPDEQNYQSHLLPFDEALKMVWGAEERVLRYVWAVYLDTLRTLESQRQQEQAGEQDQQLESLPVPESS